MSSNGEIMVVDDEPENLRLLADVLSAEGYTVRPTKNPKLALESAFLSPPDLILLDIKMPGMDGYEVCKRLKQGEHTAQLPVIFISALQDMPDKVCGFEAGGVDFITKPFQREEVLARISAQMELLHIRRQLEEKVQELSVVNLKLQTAHGELEKSEKKFRSYFELPLSGMAIFDTEGRWVELNDKMCEIVGYSREELMGFVWTDAIHPDDIDPCISLINEIKNNIRDQRTIEKRLVSKNGKITYVEASVGCVRNQEDYPEFYIVLMEDISLRKQQQQALEDYKNNLEDLVRHRTSELEESNKNLEDFAYIASHDLQEPLRKVITFGDRLKEKTKQLDEVSVDCVNRMQNSAIRMQAFINDLLSYSKLSIERQPFEWVELNNIIKESLSNLQVRLDQTQGTINVDDLPGLEADPFQMRQLFQNLIDNALKYHKKKITPVINIQSRLSANGEIKIAIEDNGVGFDEKYTERIFQPFQRLHGKDEYEGTGIGLAICKKIIDRHHGTIIVNSNPGEGTTLIITFPEKQPQV